VLRQQFGVGRHFFAVEEFKQKLMRGRTSFVVAHRLSTIKESDVILVMRDGNIVEQGDHESLLAKTAQSAKRSFVRYGRK